MNVNSQYFDDESVKAGELNNFVGLLMKEAYSKSKYYNDIHIYPADCGAFIVEWAQTPWGHEFGGSFQYVDEDERVMIEKQMPDETYEYFESEEEYRDVLEDWLKEHPNWVKDYNTGRYYDSAEQEKLKKELGLGE